MSVSAWIRAQLIIKRAADIVGAALLLALLFPVMVVIALAVRATSPGDIIFRQKRVGENGRPFTIYKFRTMIQEASRHERGSYVYAGDPRVTPVGKFLRMAGLDELPQLVNIVKGEMSFVGPRPDLPHHVETYTAFQRQRLEVRPGITGWAQVAGRTQLSWEERIKLDVEYIRDWSLLRDLRVVLRTVVVVLTGRGAPLPADVGTQQRDDGKETP